MGVTIKKLSELSGFSTATISRVLSGSDNVKKETREEIEKLLIEYNYRTNAIDLRQRKVINKTVLILTGDLDNWYYMEIIRRLTQHILREEYIPLVAYTDNQIIREEEFVRMAITEEYAGIVFMNVRGGENLKKILKANQYPTVFINRRLKSGSFDTVCNDNYRGGYRATDYLIQKGHKRIGHLMGSVYSNTAIERKRGYEDAMHDHGLVVTENSILHGDQNYKSSYRCGEKIIKSCLDFTALFCSTYQITEGLLDALADYGVHVPNDISVIGFDETPTMERKMINTVCTDPEKMSSMAWKLLRERIGDRTKEMSMIYLETKMRERNSVRDLN